MLDARGFDGKGSRNERKKGKASNKAISLASSFLALAVKESIITSDGVLISTPFHNAAQPKPHNCQQRG